MATSAPAPAPESAPEERRVKRRHVLYLSGFDPQGPGHYHALYAEQAALQAQATGGQIEVGPRQREAANAAWDVRWRAAGSDETVETRYEFLRWDDIVRQHWPRGQARLLGLTLTTTAQLVANGSLWRILQTSWPAFLALVFPAALILGASAALLGLWGVAGWLGHALTWWWGLALAGAGTWLLAKAAQWAQRKVQMAWLMRSACVVLRQARGTLPALEGRLDAFAARLCELARRPDLDEVLVIGHSSGAMLAASVMARAIAADPALLQREAPVAMLTLGECIPLLSYQPEATAFRAELAALRAQSALVWVDVTAPPDGCCFALVDPTEVCEDALPANARTSRGPKRVSPKFAQCFSPESYQRVRRDKYRCHFQYLMAVERPEHYDFFATSAGPRPLWARFALQASVTGFVAFQCFGGPTR